MNTEENQYENHEEDEEKDDEEMIELLSDCQTAVGPSIQMNNDSFVSNQKRPFLTSEPKKMAPPTIQPQKSTVQAWKSRGDYFHHKNIKLRDQYLDEQKNNVESGMFQGVVIHVDGFTQPGMVELREMVYQHGGAYEQYFSRRLVTHVIATNLPHSKIKEYSSMDERTRTFVVRPEWILDSIRLGCKQPERSYLLLSDQKQVMIAFKNNNAVPLNPSNATESEPRANNLHNAATDPNFVKNFLKNSRLHFIGSWRRRFMERNEYTIKKHASLRKKLALRPNTGNYFVVHLDMDCFFAAIAMKQNPRLRTLPMAVAHSGSNTNGEISSANYVAREFGVKAGMWIGRAKELCKDLIIVPYQFNLYEEAALQVYEILKQFVPADSIEVSSIDESYIYMHQTCVDEAHATDLVSQIRKKIETTTGCTASAGIGPNKLLARMATKKAKPNGQFLVSQSLELSAFMSSFTIRDLSGVGRKMNTKLEKELGVTTVEQLLTIEKTKLQQVFGTKKGETLYKQCRGEETVDDFSNQDSGWDKKSRTVEVNYGIRFDKIEQVNFFLEKLCEEMSERLQLENILAKCITLKMMKRHPDAPIEPTKFNGHGMCETFSKSATMPDHTNELRILSQHAKSLYEQLKIEPCELRGIGIRISKITRIIRDRTTMRVSQFFQRIDKHNENENAITNEHITETEMLQNTEPIVESNTTHVQAREQLPNISQIDADIFESLPEDIRNELIEAYRTNTTRPASTKPTKTNKQTKSTLGKRKPVSNPIIGPKQKKLFHFVERVTSPKESIKVNIIAPPPNTQDVARGMYSQVNYQVLKELPTQIQQQVLLDAHQDKQQKQRLTVKPLTLTTQDNNSSSSTLDETSEVQMGDNSTSDPAYPLYSNSFSDNFLSLKDTLRKWIDSFPELIKSQSSPTLFDNDELSSAKSNSYLEMLKGHNQSHLRLELLLQYFDQLIFEDKNLELATRLLRFIRRLCQKASEQRQDSEFWRWFFNSQVLNHIQSSMIQKKYRSVLPVGPIGAKPSTPNTHSPP